MSNSSEPHLLLDHFLPYRLNVLASLVSEALSAQYSNRFGISVAEWRVIATLGQHKIAKASIIARHAHMHKTKVSRAVQSLYRRGLLEKSQNKDDLREASLSLSSDGHSLYCALVPLAEAFAQNLTAILSDEEAAWFDHVLAKLTAQAQKPP